MARFLAAKTAPVQFCIGSASGGSGVSADSPMPEELEAIPSWYEEQWESKVGSSQWALRKLNEAELNPGHTWRKGLAENTSGRTPTFEYYSGGVAGTQENKRDKPRIKNTDRDEVRPREYYKAPHDVIDMISEAIEEPGVLEGSSAIHNLPNIHALSGRTLVAMCIALSEFAWTRTACTSRYRMWAL